MGEDNMQATDMPPATRADQPRTGVTNGRLWGSRADDWSELQEPLAGPAYEAAFTRAGVTTGTRLLDVGCGAGLAAQGAAKVTCSGWVTAQQAVSLVPAFAGA